MQNTHLRNLLSRARHFVETDGAIPYDHAVKMMQAGMDVQTIERNLRKSHGLD